MIIVIICSAVVIWGIIEIIKRVTEQNRRNEEIDREEKRRNVNQTLQKQKQRADYRNDCSNPTGHGIDFLCFRVIFCRCKIVNSSAKQ